jgi:hypothetical protein
MFYFRTIESKVFSIEGKSVNNEKLFASETEMKL